MCHYINIDADAMGLTTALLSSLQDWSNMVLQSGSPVKKLMDDYAKHMRENLICLLHCDLVDSSAQYLNSSLEILYFGYRKVASTNMCY